MESRFVDLSETYRDEIMRIFNHYVENGTAAFPANPVPVQFFSMFLQKSADYPAYVLLAPDTDQVLGFCMLSPYIPFLTFAGTACVTFFLDPAYTGRGLGSQCMEKLEDEAKKMHITHLLADISSENTGSIAFHKKHGFTVVGELQDIGEKLGRSFSITLMEKALS